MSSGWATESGPTRSCSCHPGIVSNQDIHKCPISASSLKEVRVGGTTAIRGNPGDFTVVAAAAE
jgi:hypothetical protein